MGQLTEHGASTGGSSLLCTKSHHPSKRIFFTIQNTTHAINIMCLSAMMYV